MQAMRPAALVSAARRPLVCSAVAVTRGASTASTSSPALACAPLASGPSARSWHSAAVPQQGRGRRYSTVARSGDGEEDDYVELDIKIEGMMCGGCTSRITDVLSKVNNVKKVDVSLENKMATIQVKAQSLMDALEQVPKLVTTIKELGFEAEPHIGHST